MEPIVMTQEQITACTQYFLQGNAKELIIGGVTVAWVAFMHYAAFRKKSLPQMLKDGANSVLKNLWASPKKGA